MLEKKLKKDFDAVTTAMKAGGITSTDVSRDVMRSMVKGCTSFENTFDNLIEAGKKEKNDTFPKSGKKNEVNSLESSLNKSFA